MKTKFELTLVVAALCTLTGCVDDVETPEARRGTTSDIINGDLAFGHSAVAAVRWQVTTAEGSGSATCTGALIAPRTVLTAGHCVTPADAVTRFSNYEVYFGLNAKSVGATWRPAVGVVAHPSYDPSVFGAYDVAVIILAEDAPVAPVQVASSMPDLTGSSVTHVGFGNTVSVSSQLKFGAGGYKWETTLPVTEQSNITLRTGDGFSSICNGDSGGPAFVEVNGAEVVVGVHSYIDDNERCRRNGYSARTDIAFAFIAQYGASGAAL
jgi:secreted trypsin-like serine protease